MTYTPSLFEALVSLRPGAKFSLNDNGLEWKDEVQSEPTQAEIDAELVRLAQEHPFKEAQANRALAYKEESDALFFKAQRGEIPLAEWEAKVAEIRARFPYPEI